ncbi:uncharacterized protein C8Q71DRAFT_373022 [Rhodofomes roseus]|uniref:DUF6533 domain-containing protein n=1 Tax=Rhodofomes roseus TaxID=34475 RepID=A0ABQ8K1H0_9APHY|nr:uncharacterized protein C8Q71DRAFT_373022 [Rhodofomes roseus]KAH9830293.1 hypothetical protein C8Q71DRAFT_373022 [Rhodofomes roseus]
MSNIPATEVPPLLSGFFTQNCLTASIVAFLIYDYVLTLGLELELFWCRRGAILSRLLFFVLRLSIIATAIMNVLSTFVTELEINERLTFVSSFITRGRHLSSLQLWLRQGSVTALLPLLVASRACISGSRTS